MQRIYSCYGPFGRVKLISNQTGDIVIAKDAKQLLPLIEEIASAHPFLQHVQDMIVSHCKEMGDGTLSSFFMIHHTIHAIDQLSSSLSSTEAIRFFSEIRYAITTIRKVFISKETIISDLFVTAELWKEIDHFDDEIIYKLLFTLLLPSSNIETATKISEVMVKWLSSNEMNELLNKCQHLLQHLDDYLFIQLIDPLVDDNLFYQLPFNEMILQGHFIDFTTFEESHIKHQCVCIQHFHHHHHEDDHDELRLNTTLLLNIKNNNTNTRTIVNNQQQDIITMLSSTINLNQLRHALILLKYSHIQCVFCMEAVTNPGILEAFASNGIHLITNIPLYQLQLFARKGLSIVYDSFNEMIQSLQLHDQQQQQQHENQLFHYFSFNKLRRISLKINQLSKEALFIEGINCCFINHKHGMDPHYNMGLLNISQVLIQNSSITAAVTSRLLIIRCLQLLKFSLFFSKNQESKKSCLRIFYGGIINELIWSILLQSIASSSSVSSSLLFINSSSTLLMKKLKPIIELIQNEIEIHIRDETINENVYIRRSVVFKASSYELLTKIFIQRLFNYHHLHDNHLINRCFLQWKQCLLYDNNHSSSHSSSSSNNNSSSVLKTKNEEDVSFFKIHPNDVFDEVSDVIMSATCFQSRFHLFLNIIELYSRIGGVQGIIHISKKKKVKII